MIVSNVERDTIKQTVKDPRSPQQEQIEFCASVGGLGK